MAEVMSEIVAGPVDHEAEVTECEANGAIAQWSPVVLGAAGRDSKPKVGTTTTAKDRKKYGVKVGPNYTVADEDTVSVVTRGRAKVKVNGAVSIGDALVTTTTAGKAGKLTHTTYGTTYGASNHENVKDDIAAVLGKALSAATADGDIILIDVNPSNLDT